MIRLFDTSRLYKQMAFTYIVSQFLKIDYIGVFWMTEIWIWTKHGYNSQKFSFLWVNREMI